METTPTGTSDTPGTGIPRTAGFDLDALGLGSLAHTKRRAPTDRTTRRLALAVGGALLFFVGVRLGHGSRPPALPAAATAPAPPAAGGAGAPATTGKVKVVDGNDLYVTDTSGAVFKVLVSDSTTMVRSGPATAHDIQPGDTVVVEGTRNNDGSVAATGLKATANEPANP